MKKVRWIVLGYFMALFINGCDLGVSSNNNDAGIPGADQPCDYGDLGTVPWNPVYVTIVD